FQTGDSEAQSQFDFHFRKWTADSRPSHPTCDYRSLSEYSAADGISGGLAFYRDADRRGGCECASVKNRGAFPPADGGSRFCSRVGAGGADEGKAGTAVLDGDKRAA